MDNARRQQILDLLDQACASDIFAAVTRDEWIEELDVLPDSALALLPRLLSQLLAGDASAPHGRTHQPQAGRRHAGHRQTLSAAAIPR